MGTGVRGQGTGDGGRGSEGGEQGVRVIVGEGENGFLGTLGHLSATSLQAGREVVVWSEIGVEIGFRIKGRTAMAIGMAIWSWSRGWAGQAHYGEATAG